MIALTEAQRHAFAEAVGRAVGEMLAMPEADGWLVDFAAGRRVVLITLQGLAVVAPDDAAEMLGVVPVDEPHDAGPGPGDTRPGMYL